MSDLFEDILSARLSRRSFFKYSSLAALTCGISLSKISSTFSGVNNNWQFDELIPDSFDEIDLAQDYRFYSLLSWGESLSNRLEDFNPKKQSAKSQANQVGYNHDFICFFEISKNEALLGINHEYSNPKEMFEFMDIKPKDYGKIQLEAVGITIAKIKLVNGQWALQKNSKYNRRITATTKIKISGIAKGHDRLKTSYDKKAEFVYGTLANCSGGKTPFNTMLSAEENIDFSFSGKLPKNHKEKENYSYLGIGKKKKEKHFAKIDPRFNLSKEPNEANRFGYVVEVDPFNPKKTPKKLTSLGRFMHECAETILNHDGKVVTYMADDARFEHIYKFVSKDSWQKGENEDTIFDDGILYVAKFYDNGNLEWIPLIYGNKGLTKKDGFLDQASIAIETRKAAKNVGATKMDRPEGITIDKKNGKVYIALTNNIKRFKANSSNPRAFNMHGHIIELTAKNKDYANKKDKWNILLLAGDDKSLEKQSRISSPDNLTVGPDDNLWIATDGMNRTLKKNDGLFVCSLKGLNRGQPKLFFQGPKGAEICSPCFSEDKETLFISIQHPGKDQSQWPDNNSNWPSRPSIVAITKA